MSYIILVKLQGGKEYRSQRYYSEFAATVAMRKYLAWNRKAKRGKIRESFKEGQI